MGNFLGTPIIWFISSLFQKHADASFLPRQALLVITECKKCLLSKLSLEDNLIISEENLSINSSQMSYKITYTFDQKYKTFVKHYEIMYYNSKEIAKI